MRSSPSMTRTATYDSGLPRVEAIAALIVFMKFWCQMGDDQNEGSWNYAWINLTGTLLHSACDSVTFFCAASMATLVWTMREGSPGSCWGESAQGSPAVDFIASDMAETGVQRQKAAVLRGARPLSSEVCPRAGIGPAARCRPCWADSPGTECTRAANILCCQRCPGYAQTSSNEKSRADSVALP